MLLRYCRSLRRKCFQAPWKANFYAFEGAVKPQHDYCENIAEILAQILPLELKAYGHFWQRLKNRKEWLLLTQSIHSCRLVMPLWALKIKSTDGRCWLVKLSWLFTNLAKIKKNCSVWNGRTSVSKLEPFFSNLITLLLPAPVAPPEFSKWGGFGSSFESVWQYYESV